MAHALKHLDIGCHNFSEATLAYYEAEAEAYFAATIDADMSAEHERFLQELPPRGLILDAGSGSGRDTKVFLDRGYTVDAFDASPAMASLSSAFTGQTTEVATFENWTGKPDTYDGIWAFASLLHVTRSDLPGVLRTLCDSLKPGGWLFCSFKYGRVNKTDRLGRHYTNLTIKAAEELFESIGGLSSVEAWRVIAPEAKSETTSWLYCLVRKAGQS